MTVLPPENIPRQPKERQLSQDPNAKEVINFFLYAMLLVGLWLIVRDMVPEYSPPFWFDGLAAVAISAHRWLYKEPMKRTAGEVVDVFISALKAVLDEDTRDHYPCSDYQERNSCDRCAKATADINAWLRENHKLMWVEIAGRNDEDNIPPRYRK